MTHLLPIFLALAAYFCLAGAFILVHWTGFFRALFNYDRLVRVADGDARQRVRRMRYDYIEMHAELLGSSTYAWVFITLSIALAPATLIIRYAWSMIKPFHL